MIVPPCGHEAAKVEQVRVPHVYPYPLFNRCGVCGREFHRGWVSEWRATMEALAAAHMTPRVESDAPRLEDHYHEDVIKEMRRG